MSVFQTNEWVCDLCGAIEALRQEVDAYNDPVVTPPPDWDVFFEVPERFREHPSLNIAHACPKCKAAPNWSQYRLVRGKM